MGDASGPGDRDEAKPVLPLKRLREIGTILFEEGFHHLVNKLHLKPCVSWRCRLRCIFRRGLCEMHLKSELPFEIRFVNTLTRLGPTFIKLGQVLAMRQDFLPEKLCEALSQLHSHVPVFDTAIARRIVESELQKPIAEVFSNFEEEPMAAASLAQVHRAVLRSGEHIVLKVQRPDIEEIVDSDLKLLLVLTERAEKNIPSVRKYKPHQHALDFAAYTRKELDFQNEAQVMKRIRENLKDTSHVYIPKPYLNLCTRRLLVMEEIKGSQLDVEAPPAHLSKETIARQLADTIVQQVFVHGIFHADPHPGNIIVMNDGKIALIDFGMYGEIDRHMQRQIFWVLLLTAEGKFDEAARALIAMAEISEYSDLKGYHRELIKLYGEWSHAKMSEMSMAKLVLSELKLGGEYNVQFPRGFILMLRTTITVESVAQRLFPDAYMSQELMPMLKKALFQNINVGQFLSEIGKSLPELLLFLELAPAFLTQAITQTVNAENRSLESQATVVETRKGNTGPWFLISSLWISGALLAFNKALPQLAGGLSWLSLAVLGLAGLGTVYLLHSQHRENL